MVHIMSCFLTPPCREKSDGSCRLFEALLDQFVDAILLYDEHDLVVRANRAAGNLFRASADDLVGRGVWELVHCSVDETFMRDDEIRTVIGEGREWRFDCAASCFDGVDRPLSLTISTIELDDRRLFCMVMREISRWVALFRRIKEDEESFHGLFENFGDPLLILSLPEGTVRLMNQRAEEMFGYDREEVVGSLPPFFPDGELDRILQTVRYGAGGESFSRRMSAMRRDGSPLLVSVDMGRISLRGEEVLYGTVRDITEMVRLEEESRTIQAQLIYANKMSSLGLLVAGIAHEINNPNNYILANAEVLKGIAEDLGTLVAGETGVGRGGRVAGLPVETVRESLPEMIDAIIDGSRRIRNIVAGLKEYARKGRESTSQNDLNGIVDSALLLVRHQIGRYTDRFELRRWHEPIILSCSAQQIEQVVINILLNALESLGGRDRRVTLSTSVSHDGEQGVITVTDEGVGIPQEDLERIFEPFFTTRLDRGGTGLGLSISSSIIRRHGGTIDIESEPGKGTTVTISLPLGTRTLQKGEQQR